MNSKKGDCIFCQIIDKKLPAKVEYEDGRCIVFHTIEPMTEVHWLLVPKKHISSVAQMKDQELDEIAYLFKVARDLAREKGIPGYKLLMNVNKEGGQVIFHIHLHFLSGKQIVKGQDQVLFGT